MKHFLIATATFLAMSLSPAHADTLSDAEAYMAEVVLPNVCDGKDEICIEFTRMDAADFYNKGESFRALGMEFPSPFVAGYIIASSIHDDIGEKYPMYMARMFEYGYEGNKK